MWFVLLMFVYGISFRIFLEDYTSAIINTIGLITSMIIFYFSQNRKLTEYLILPVIIMIMIFNIYYWFVQGGLNGNGMMFFSSVIVALILVSDKWINAMTIILVVLELILIVLDKYFRHLAIWGENQKEHSDFSLISLLIIYLIWYLKKNYTNKEKKINKFSRSLKELHRLNLNQATDLDETLNDYLITAAGILRLRYGSIVKINPDSSVAGKIELSESRSPSKTSNFARIQDQLIEEVKLKEQSVHYINGKGNFSDKDPKNRNPISFIGTPIMLDDNIYGVLNFYSDRVRKREFEEYEIEIIELMALNISHLLGLKNWKASQKDVKMALQLSENKFEGIFEGANLGISMSDINGRIIISNPALQDLLGFSANELQNTFFYSYSHPDDLAEDLRLYEALIIGKINSYQLEKRVISKSNEVIDIWLTVSMTKSQEENESFVISFFDNISLRRKAENEVQELNSELAKQVSKLEDVNKELEAFSYSISHDLRAPLRAIDGFSKIVIEDYQDKLDDEGKRLLNVITTNSQKMSNLIDDLLTFSRISRKTTEFKTINIEHLVKEIIEELGFDKSIFDISLLPEIQGERTLMKQVFSNLMNNAVKFTSKKANAKISIGATEEGEHFKFYIIDNGVGFDMRYYDKLFGVFQRLHTDEEFKGTGVGLAIVEKVISKHKGEIWAESVLGVGTTFYFIIPKVISS